MNVKRDEKRVAEELDALLTAQLAGRKSPSPSELSETEAAFASVLVEAAEATQPAPSLVADLAAQLERAARNPGQTRLSFLQNLLTRRQPLFKRMTIALVGAVILATAIFVLPFLNSRQNLPPLPSLAVMSVYAQGG